MMITVVTGEPASVTNPGKKIDGYRTSITISMTRILYLSLIFPTLSHHGIHQVNPPGDTLLSKLNSPDAGHSREYTLGYGPHGNMIIYWIYGTVIFRRETSPQMTDLKQS